MPIIIEKDHDGYYASCPSLQGCYTQGDTYDEALNNIRDSISLHLQDRLDRGEVISVPEFITVATLEVAA